MQSTKQIKIPTAILEIIPRRLQRKIPDVRPVQGFAYIIRLALISGLGGIHKLGWHDEVGSSVDSEYLLTRVLTREYLFFDTRVYHSKLV